MVQLQRYLKQTNDFQNSKHLPLLNSLFIERFSELNPYSHENGFKTFMKWARRSPALLGFANIIATDILSDDIEFEPIATGTSGKNKKLKAKNFWNQNKGMEVAEETIYDFLFVGIGYNWLGLLSDVQMKEFCEVTAREVFPELESKEHEQKAEKLFQSLKLNNADSIPKKLRHIAATTVTIHTDEYEVLKYIQRVGVKIRRFEPKEVLRFKLMPLDGKIYPFPPLEALLAEIYLLWLISQNYVSYFENGGKPDNVFILPKEIAGSKNHEYLIDTLKKYKKIQNKHGNLVFTGDLNIDKLMEVEHQMENKDLGLYLVSMIAMFYGIPVNRIPFLVGKAAAGGDSGGLADSGYWRKISVWQSKFEAEYNLKLWNPFFGVNMKFRRGYLQDEVRETQNEMQKTSVVEQRLRLGLWTTKAAGAYLKIDEAILEEAQKEKEERDAKSLENSLKSGMDRQNLETDRNTIPNQDNRLKAKKKQETQLDNQTKAGGKKINP